MSTRFAGRLGLALVSLLLTLSSVGCNHVGTMHFYSIPSKSMQPTLYEGDKIVVDEGYYSSRVIRDGDVVVFRHNDNVIAKRVMAVSGESIKGLEGKIFRNGQALQENYAIPPAADAPSELITFALRQVGPDEIFVVGDNRGASLDSRVAEFGPVHRRDVPGKVVSVYDSSHPTAGRTF